MHCSIAFTRPNNPDAGSLWPDLDLDAETTRGSFLLVTLFSPCSAPNSIGSPSAVPVPCSCNKSNVKNSSTSTFSDISAIAMLIQSF